MVTPRKRVGKSSVPVRKPITTCHVIIRNSSDTYLPTSCIIWRHFVTFIICVRDRLFLLHVFCQLFFGNRCAPMYILSKVWTNRKEHMGRPQQTPGRQWASIVLLLVCWDRYCAHISILWMEIVDLQTTGLNSLSHFCKVMNQRQQQQR
jgi:hypothetical protein